MCGPASYVYVGHHKIIALQIFAILCQYVLQPFSIEAGRLKRKAKENNALVRAPLQEDEPAKILVVGNKDSSVLVRDCEHGIIVERVIGSSCKEAYLMPKLC
jgi:hypothetical protein